MPTQITVYRLLLASLVASLWVFPQEVEAGIHEAPIVLRGYNVRAVARYPLSMYRLYRTGPNGMAVPIPFQFDEINEIGDYVLDQGSPVTAKTGNGIFDLRDELAFMGNDVGPLEAPKRWPNNQPPTVVYEVRFANPVNKAAKPGAVYIGIFFDKSPMLPPITPYVIFNLQKGEVITSRYRYEFDKQNYLILKNVDMVKRDDQGKRTLSTLLDSASFFLRADLKYFLTFEVNHRSINSKIEAYKTGPIRTIARISFFYSILKLKFELGMYTEVSFFSNSVLLPAVMYNPLDGQRNVNKGSGFYYGFAVRQPFSNYKIETNMEPYREATSLLDMFKSDPKPQSLYWLAATGADHMMYVEIAPSDAMLSRGNIPRLYREDVAGTDLLRRSNDKALPLGKSPVNLALYFDLTKFDEGEHKIAFRLFFENRADPKDLEVYRNLNDWQISVQQL